MKRWFCGMVSENPSSAVSFLKPREGKLVWDGSKPLWLCGSWKQQQSLEIAEGSVR